MEEIVGSLVEEVSSNVFYKCREKASRLHAQTNSREATHEVEETVERGESEDEEEEEEEEEQEQRVGEEEEHRGAAQSDRSGFVSWNVLDPEVLDCRVCCEPLTIPVFQCKNGHIACKTCCTGTNKCPYCSSTIGYDRCRAIEKILESVQVKCTNTKFGCKETLNYSKKRDHEKTCKHAPCSCPLPECSFIGTASRLYDHFSFRHKDAAVGFIYNRIIHIAVHAKRKFLVLQEERDGNIFILNNRVEPIGHVISVCHIAPTWKAGIFYSILTKSGGSSLRFQSYTHSIPNRRDRPPSIEEFLVPAKKFGYYKQLNLDIRIRR